MKLSERLAQSGAPGMSPRAPHWMAAGVARPVEDAPVEVAPVEVAPVEVAPVEVAPVEATPAADAPVAVEPSEPMPAPIAHPVTVGQPAAVEQAVTDDGVEGEANDEAAPATTLIAVAEPPAHYVGTHVAPPEAPAAADPVVDPITALMRGPRVLEFAVDDEQADGQSADEVRYIDPFAEIKRKMHRALLDLLGPTLYDAEISTDTLGDRVRQALHQVVESDGVELLTAADRARILAEVSDEILGYGPLEPYLRDEDVSEIMVNGSRQIYVERHGRIHAVPASFTDDAHVRATIDKIVGRVGRRIDEASPMVDARLPDGSRVNAVISPIALDGPTLTIRKFATDPLRVRDLIQFGTLSATAAQFLEACVRSRLNIVISGGTGSGKTTTLNVLSSFVPADERIVTIEDAAELQLLQSHVVRMESRPSNIEGRGEITARDLVRNSLRMRPDRIIVGEVRDGAALDMLQAMNTGHAGSLTTLHANSPRDALARIETMVLMAGVELPSRAIREQVASAIDLVVHQTRLRDGTRRVTHITEVLGMEGDVITLQDLFAMVDLHGNGPDVLHDGAAVRHELRPTGIRPALLEKLDLDPAPASAGTA